jgi:hypothetical protein
MHVQLEHMHRQMYDESNVENLRNHGVAQNDFITCADIRRIQKGIEEETIRLAKQDGASILKWVEKLKSDGHYVFIKTSAGPPPPSSNLDRDVFLLIIQTKYQQECWQKHGGRFAGIDATHNTMQYKDMNLFTLMVRDRWGHGM